jgi:hypothetical protein
MMLHNLGGCGRAKEGCCITEVGVAKGCCVTEMGVAEIRKDVE